MRKLFLVIAVLLISACSETVHTGNVFIVSEISQDFTKCGGKYSKYKLTIKSYHHDYIEIFTDSLFNVGDTINLTK